MIFGPARRGAELPAWGDIGLQHGIPPVRVYHWSIGEDTVASWPTISFARTLGGGGYVDDRAPMPANTVGYRACFLSVVLFMAACNWPSTNPVGNRAVASINITPTSVFLSSEPSAFSNNGDATLLAGLLDPQGQPIAGLAPHWSSSNPGVAVVSPSGTVIGIKPGEAQIVATLGSTRGAATVTVGPPADSGIFTAAHRGFGGRFPENTLVAIAGAFALGAKAVELDVRFTQDGVPILMHDATVDRTTTGTGRVSELTFQQIEEFDACSAFGAGWGSCNVPTLRSALQLARGRGMLILELKAPLTTSAIARLLAEVRRQGMLHHVVITCFNYNVLLEFRRLDAVIALGYTDSRIPPITQVAALGRAALMVDEQALLANTEASRMLMANAAQRRVDVMAWTVSSYADARALAAIGIKHLLSDIPLDPDSLR